MAECGLPVDGQDEMRAFLKLRNALLLTRCRLYTRCIHRIINTHILSLCFKLASDSTSCARRRTIVRERLVWFLSNFFTLSTR